MTMEGTSNKALIRQVKIEITTSPLKNLIGAKFDRESAENPTITENALKKIPLPVVQRVRCTASL
jgi:hypothetical protein